MAIAEELMVAPLVTRRASELSPAEAVTKLGFGEWGGVLITGATCDQAEVWRDAAEDVTAGLDGPDGHRALIVLGDFGAEHALEWQGALRRSDVAAAVDVAFGRSEDGDMVSRLGAAMAVEFAAWDLELVGGFAAMSRLQRIDPVPVLAAALEEWFDALPPQTQQPVIQIWDGAPREHVMSLIRRERSRALEDLSWRAQLAVVLPYIDDVRRRYIDRHRSVLDADWAAFAEAGELPVSSCDDLEIAAVYHGLRTVVPPNEAALLKACQMARNALAHGRALSSADITALQPSWLRGAF